MAKARPMYTGDTRTKAQYEPALHAWPMKSLAQMSSEELIAALERLASAAPEDAALAKALRDELASALLDEGLLDAEAAAQTAADPWQPDAEPCARGGRTECADRGAALTGGPSGPLPATAPRPGNRPR